MSETTQWLAFTPRDTVLVRDGRGFDAGSDVIAETVLPLPSTVAGAARAAYGDNDLDAVRGPLLARHTAAGWTALLPTPLDLVHVAGEMVMTRLSTTEVTADTDLTGQPPQWLTGDGEPIGGWLPGDVIEDYLTGRLLAPGAQTMRKRLDVQDEPFLGELRVGLARHDRVAREGLLYQATHLRPAEDVTLLAECDLLPDLPVPTGPVPLGGRGRLADVTVHTGGSPSDQTGPRWPSGPHEPDEFIDGVVLLYVATPALWPGGWRPPLPSHAQLLAAATGAPLPIAMASPRRGTHETSILRWAVPAGSVYLVQFADPASAAAWSGEVHGKALGQPAAAAPGDDNAYRPGAFERLRTAGFGTVLTGVWQ